MSPKRAACLLGLGLGLVGLGSTSAGCHAGEGPELEAAEVAGAVAGSGAASGPEGARPHASASARDLPPTTQGERPAQAEAEADAREEAKSRSEAPPEARPEAPTEAPSAEQIASWLADADVELHALGLRRKPSTRAKGQLPDATVERAYADARAQAYYAHPDEVVDWFIQAKFGPHEPELRSRDLQYPPGAQGPLYAYDLDLVLHDTSRAYLHVAIPLEGVRPGRSGRHRTWVRGEAWSCLCDRSVEGQGHVSFKTNGGASPHRQWGRAWVVERLVALAKDYARRTGAPLGIGDLSLPLGGKISDHWTHRRGVDVDVYLLGFPEAGDAGLGPPTHRWHQDVKGESRWTPDDAGKEPAEVPEGAASPTSKRLIALADAALKDDKIWFFVHDAVGLLEPFDRKAQARRPGRRYLHAENRAFWPAHRDHVHIRWSDRPLPVGKPPKP